MAKTLPVDGPLYIVQVEHFHADGTGPYHVAAFGTYHSKGSAKKQGRYQHRMATRNGRKARVTIQTVLRVIAREETVEEVPAR
ncbi:hypothetical protein SEA_GRETCHEN_32 [Microbacterium phage Gretchen]|uniref:Uncharacterized protein n=1 Tax=Microbacterium phage Percival TaxID=2201439 RepID=A0A2Z4Q6X6_9CAUD|nr:hypothetical protein PBI_PERCIVAL_32 [Microbacterium phage Percival]UDL14806.1 hypothetical protein SEA_GRETCHEN_32 [Microbacterium phage Gretchen]